MFRLPRACKHNRAAGDRGHGKRFELFPQPMTSIRFPNVDKIGLGLGMDMPWREPMGFFTDESAGDTITGNLANFLLRYGPRFQYAFAAFQPKDRNRYRACDY